MDPDSTTDLVFYAVLALLFGHELDGVEHYEWRLLPLLRSLPDGATAPLFTALHVPLFVALFRLVTHPSERTRHRLRLLVDAFAVVHAGLHVYFSDDPAYEFDGPLSKLLIYGAAVAGLLGLGLVSVADGADGT